MTGPAPHRRIVGCMTGTSLDGLDAALLEIRGRGLEMSATLVRSHSVDLGELGPRLRALAEQHPMTAGQIAALARDVALLHAQAVADLLAGARADLVCAHGQTVFHAPPLSWQVINAPVLAHELQTPVVFDLRAADLAAGGQGAPITPIADWVLFRRAEPSAVVNLGGFCNVTLLPADVDGPGQIIGMDVCACNHLLDAVARGALGRAYDEGGAAALRGTVLTGPRDALAAGLRHQSRAGRSLGSGDEAREWVSRHRSAAHGDDLAATACAAVGMVIRERIAASHRAGVAPTIIFAGGGALNAALARSICGDTPRTTAAHGIPVTHREAACFAVLGALCEDGVPITLPAVTGVGPPAPVAGCWARP